MLITFPFQLWSILLFQKKFTLVYERPLIIPFTKEILQSDQAMTQINFDNY